MSSIKNNIVTGSETTLHSASLENIEIMYYMSCTTLDLLLICFSTLKKPSTINIKINCDWSGRKIYIFFR